MKKLFLLLFCTFIISYTFAQNNEEKMDDVARIILVPYVPKQIEGMPVPAMKNLENKLNQIAIKSGLGGKSIDGRFIITANVSVLTKDITPTAPPMHAYTIEVTLYIGDGIEGTSFSSTSVVLKGVGDTEQKAYMAALKNLKVSDPSYQTFIELGKVKIIEYYNSKCDFIVKEAEMLASKNDFEGAIAKLVSVPNVCKDCYDKCMDAVQPIYQKLLDRDCALKLQEAKGIWSSGQDIESATRASAVLAEVDPAANCYDEVKNLTSEISKRVKELDQREWENMQLQQKREYDLEKQSIEAIRAIGVAYGENQQPTYNILW